MINTPYFVVNKALVDEAYSSLTSALDKYWGNYIIGYSYKTNALPWAINYFKSKGAYAEVVSDDEYGLAKYIGNPIDKIVYNGPIKTKETMLEAIKGGAIVNIDAQREIEWLSELDKGQDLSVGIRVNFDIEKLCPAESACGDEGGRFGFCYENGELLRAINKIKAYGISVKGIHLHTSSKTRGLNIYKAIAKVACEVASEYGLELDYIDVGGGFFGGLPTKPQFEDYLREISAILKQSFDPKSVKLIVEPGMSVIGANISYVTSVIDVKQTSYGYFAVTDGSRMQIDPLMTKSSYFYEIKSACESKNINKIAEQTVCGYTCMEHDRLFKLRDANELNVGDIITYHKVGAYTMCLAPLFIKYFPDVYLNDGGKLIKIREKWTPEFYVQGSEL